MHRASLPLAALAAVVIATVSPVVFGAQRTFVSTGGSDLAPCSLAAPCRSFATALSRTDANGEVIVLDSGGYGPVAIAQSVAITSPPGVYAGVSVFGGIGIDIDAPGIRVVLRGLMINGLGGSTGISLLQGSLLQIERCAIAGMSTYGLYAVAENSTVVVTDSVISDNGNSGVHMAATAMTATLERVRVERNATVEGEGIWLRGGIKASVRDSTVAGNGGNGMLVDDSAGAGAAVTISNSVVTDNVQAGIFLLANAGQTARVSVSDSVVARNGQSGIVTLTSNAGSVGITDIVRTSIAWNTGDGVYFGSQTGAATRGALTASTIANNSGDGVYVIGAGTIAVVSSSTLLRNLDHGFAQSSGVFRSRGDNTIESSSNGNTLGTISPASGPY